MAVTVVIPGALRELAGDRDEIQLERAAGTVQDTLDRLWELCPAVRDRVLTERNEIRPHVNIFVDGENIRFSRGFATPVREGAEVILVPAVSGG